MSTPATYSRNMRENLILSASPTQLVVELYNGARRHLREGAAAMGDRNIEGAHNSLRRGELIIRYLDQIIDDEQGDLAARLHSIYRFSLRHINEARMQLDRTKVEEVIRILGGLRDAWREIAE